MPTVDDVHNTEQTPKQTPEQTPEQNAKTATPSDNAVFPQTDPLATFQLEYAVKAFNDLSDFISLKTIPYLDTLPTPFTDDTNLEQNGQTMTTRSPDNHSDMEESENSDEQESPDNLKEEKIPTEEEIETLRSEVKEAEKIAVKLSKEFEIAFENVGDDNIFDHKVELDAKDRAANKAVEEWVQKCKAYRKAVALRKAYVEAQQVNNPPQEEAVANNETE